VDDAPLTDENTKEEEDVSNNALPDDDKIDQNADPKLLPPMTDFQVSFLTPLQFELFASLLASTEWNLAVTLRDQIALAVRALHFSSARLSFGQLGRLFNKNKGVIYRMYEKSLTEMKPRGRPPALQPDQLEAVQRFIAERWADGTPLTFDAIAHFIDRDLRVVLPIDAVRHLVYNIPGVKVVTGKPMERQRLEVSPEELIEFYDRLRTVMTGLPADMVFNLDEAGYQEWSDRTDIKVIVPESYPDDTVGVPYNRSDSRSSMLVCVSASGASLQPLILVPRATTEQELYEIGYTPDKLHLAHQENGFINTALFDSWITEVFLAWVDRRRAELSYPGWAVLLLDGCFCHCSDETMNQCTSHGVLVIILPPHSSYQIQALDVGVLAIHKAVMKRVFTPNWLSNQSKQIYRMLGGWYAVATPPNIVSAFKQVGIHVEWSHEHKALLVKIDPTTARRLREPRTPEDIARYRQRLNIRI
jgi:hypothetical protein